ncbi:polysaccharide pyruvyl transferase family protein [Candidatus Cloacimonadota bacterium]
MKKVINIYWFRKHKTVSNFGDELTPYIINKLTCDRIKYFKFAGSRYKIFRKYITGLIKGKYSLVEFKDMLYCLRAKEYIIAIGSILGKCSSSRCIVWGSGIIKRKEKIRKSNFLAVRGKYSVNRINECGFKSPVVIGDPALLLPLIYTPENKKKYKLGIIPHINHLNYLRNHIDSKEIHIINLNENNLEKVIDDINSCEVTISSSLHGLIVSHAYNIKSIWFTLNHIPLYGDDIKFYDYFSSANIQEYPPYDFSELMKHNPDKIIELINMNGQINSFKNDIYSIQKQLIEISPFRIKNNIKKYFTNID